MLNPPLSFLSDDLIAYIVDHVSNLADGEVLHDLSLSDRAFTHFCQTYIFRVFRWDASWIRTSKSMRQLEKKSKILDQKPSLANQVRTVELVIANELNAWLFNDAPINNGGILNNDGLLANIMQLLAKSPIPPYELHLGGPTSIWQNRAKIEDPILVVGWLMQSFFSHSLTVLHLSNLKNTPLPIFLICPRLREVILANVRVTVESYDGHAVVHPVDHCSGRELPSLELLEYRRSHSVVKQMITPPPMFSTPVVLWSKLRVLTLSPHEVDGMAYLQPILDRACNTLNELHLTSLKIGDIKQRPLAGLVNLSSLSSLRVFALYTIIKCGTPSSEVLSDISIVLGTIPTFNNVTNLFFDFSIVGEHPYDGCLEQDWVGICNESVRISAGKPLELDFQISVSLANLASNRPGHEELFAKIREKTSLPDDPNICAHFWDPTCWRLGRGPFTRGQVRSRCRP